MLQAKYKAQLDGMSLDQTWFFAQVRGELDGWVKARSNRRRAPEYLLLATNVRLSGVADTGGIDRLDNLLKEFAERGLRLKGYQVWHADKIRALLDNHYDVRRAYADLVLPGDVIARLHEQLQESDAKVEQAWLGHAGRALLADGTVALGESGDAANTPLALEQVAVDLAAHFDGMDHGFRGALATIVGRGDNVLAPTLAPAHKERIVLLGGPGQGKSTIARLLCQLYRVAMLGSHEPSRVVADVREAAERMRAAFDDAGLPRPPWACRSSVGLHRPLLPAQQAALWFWVQQGPVDSSDDETWQLAVTRLRELGEHAESLGLQLSLEMYEDTLLGSPASAVRLLEDIGLDVVGLNPDLGNLFRLHRQIPPFAEWVETCLPVTNYWHIKSYFRDEDPATGGYVGIPAPMEIGTINYRQAIRRALELGFTGSFCVEHYGGDDLSVSAQNARYIRRMLAVATGEAAAEVLAKAGAR